METLHKAETLQTPMQEPLAEQVRSRGPLSLMERAQGKIALGAAVLAGSLGVAEMGAKNAEASTAVQPDGTTIETTVHIAKSKSSAQALAKANLVTNYRSVSKARIRKAKKAGDCETMSGREAAKEGIFTQGYMGTGVGFAPENRRSTLCDLDKDGDFDVRAECGNAVKVRQPKPKLAKITHWVAKKAKIKVKAVANAHAEATCSTANTSASAEGRGRGVAAIRQRIKFFQKSKAQGESIDLVSSIQLAAADEAKAKASANAYAQCQEGPSQPTPESSPPNVNVVGPQHLKTGGEFQFSSYENDPDSDIVDRAYSETGQGEFLSVAPFQGDEPGEWHMKYKAGTEPETACVTVNVRDAKNNTGSDTECFPVVGDEDPRGEF